MSRKQTKASFFPLPSELIPDTALIPNLTLDLEAQALRDHLRLALERAGFAPMESFAFCTRLLTAFCEDGSVRGIAVHPPSSPIKTEKGQRRRVRSAAQPVRQRADEPILLIVARLLIKDGLEGLSHRDHVQVAAERALTIIAETLHQLTHEPRWKSLLTTLPDFHQHRVFELHYETHGYPAYAYFAVDLHYGLIARLAQLSEAPLEKWEHALRTTITAPKALLPVIPNEWLPAHPGELETQQARAILEQAAARLEGIEPTTRADYVGKFLDLVESGAARRPYRARNARLTRRNLLDSRADDFDDAAERVSRLDARLDALAHGLDFDDGRDLTPGESDTEQALVELEGLDASDKQRQARFIRQRIVLDRNRTLSSPGVIPLHELASYYAALNDKVDSSSALERWRHLTHFVFLDFLIHTGRSPEWCQAVSLGSPRDKLWRTIQIGQTPQMPCRGTPPVYDLTKGVIAFAPDAYPTLPEWLQPPASSSADEIAAWQFRVRQHDAAYELTSFVYELPLSPMQQALVNELIRAKNEALAELKLSALSSSELFMTSDGKEIRAWNESDTTNLLAKISAYVQRLHPTWRAVSASRIAKSFHAHYCSVYGLDPVYASYISGHVDDALARPVHYSYVRAASLSEHYAQAQAKFRNALEREYADSFGSRALPLLWTQLEPGQNAFQSNAAFGSWRFPRVDVLRRIFCALKEMTADADPRAAHNARCVLYAVQLAASTGLRPFEVVGISRRAVDWKHKRIALTGKPNPAYETHRQIPIPDGLCEPMQGLVKETESLFALHDDNSLFRVFENDTLVPAQVQHIERVWQEAGTRAGLEKEQVPDLYALRHFFRSRALERNMPLATINAVMGHQVAGCELYNPYLENNVIVIMEQGRELAARILAELEGEEQPIEPAD